MAQDVKRQDFSQGPVILVKQCLIDMKIIYSYIIANKIGDENFIFKNNSFYRGLLFIKIYCKFKKKKKKKKKNSKLHIVDFLKLLSCLQQRILVRKRGKSFQVLGQLNQM